jgi:hypothetical protein
MAVPMDMRQYPLEVTRALSRRRRYRLAIPGQKFVFEPPGREIGGLRGTHYTMPLEASELAAGAVSWLGRVSDSGLYHR